MKKDGAVFSLCGHAAAYNVVRRQWCIQEFCSGGGQQTQLRTEDRDLGAVAP